MAEIERHGDAQLAEHGTRPLRKLDDRRASVTERLHQRAPHLPRQIPRSGSHPIGHGAARHGGALGDDLDSVVEPTVRLLMPAVAARRTR